MKILREDDAKGLLENAKKFQELNLDKVSQELRVIEGLFKKMIYLKENYPILARHVFSR